MFVFTRDDGGHKSTSSNTQLTKARQTGVAVAISVKQERARNLTLGETSSILIYRVKVARKETRYESQQYEQGKI